MNPATRSSQLSVLAYLWIPGWLISFFIHQSKPDTTVSFHLRQAFGWMLLSMILFALIRFRWIALGIYFLGAIYGVLNALNREEKEIPVVGSYFTQLFRNLF